MKSLREGTRFFLKADAAVLVALVTLASTLKIDADTFLKAAASFRWVITFIGGLIYGLIGLEAYLSLLGNQRLLMRARKRLIAAHWYYAAILALHAGAIAFALLWVLRFLVDRAAS